MLHAQARVRSRVALHHRTTQRTILPFRKQLGDFQPRRSDVRARAEDADKEKEKLRAYENELRDPKNFLEYLLPRPVRLAFFGGSAASCLIASLLSASRLLQGEGPDPTLPWGNAQDLVVNLIGTTVFALIFWFDRKAGEARIEQRRQIREAQIRVGDREVFINDKGEKMSRLKEVDDDWILRRLERWGKRDGMPFIGPIKGLVLKQVVMDKQPKLVVEVGTMAGYSAILMAQALPPTSRVVTYEKDLQWVLVAKRFLWQASQGQKNARTQEKVEVVWGDALQKLPQLLKPDSQEKIDLLFLDGMPKEYLDYLKAAEPFLAPGALVVADNAGVFAQGGLKPYLEYVRTNPRYKSAFIESTLEWRDDVKDGLEVSTYLGASVPEVAAGVTPAAVESAGV